MKLKLFLTFDHELPLGELKTSFDASLFEPTRAVLDLADELGVKVTLFTDILCAERFKDWDYNNFYSPYTQQLQDALKRGHDVQLHIHPHWLTSKYENSTIIPSLDFGLSDFTEKLQFNGIGGIIKQSIDELNQICIEATPDYKCVAYRAGGYNIWPSTSEILRKLHSQGILFDSSIAPGYYFKSTISEVDFRNLPSKPNWILNPDNYHNSSNENGIMEIPIATIPKTPFELPTRFKLKKYAYRAPITHGSMIHSDPSNDRKAKLKMLFSWRMLTFDNYTLSLKYLLRIIDYNVKKHKTADTLMLSIISHPKSMGDYSFELMKGFITEIKKKYPDVEFLTFAGFGKLL